MSKRIFSKPDSKEEILNKCPLCEGELEYFALHQYSNVYKILKNGKLSKKRVRKQDEGSMECGFIGCTNCDFHTDCDLGVDDTGDFKNIYIYQSNEKFTIEVE